MERNEGGRISANQSPIPKAGKMGGLWLQNHFLFIFLTLFF